MNKYIKGLPDRLHFTQNGLEGIEETFRSS